jgi:hypothetical protein
MTVPWYIWIPVLVLIVCGWWFGLQGIRHLADESEETKRKVNRWGFFAGRRCFSDAGWRYYHRTRLCFWGIMLLMLAWGAMVLIRWPSSAQ